ncbi:GNAT family N-acetyltransferase [Permianibacter sp. IMCC34836]|uniref:GNAT family N-acetyltransferase n=1 Tax=Permianibacter fluminis TaxID=2738515 RepID=UPI00155625D5|nr:GNAT family N-acetyltransferase [Permianibacter fluminis]NQD35941.1 GNAT family N-acetyltransferase [Permianibacter fluminis]
MNTNLTLREIRRDEFARLGALLVEVYSQLSGFPTPAEQPGYYDMLANIGRFTEKPDTKVLVAPSADGELFGGVVYFGDMAQYGSGGTATAERNASGIRLLAVSPRARGLGVGKALTQACIALARARHHEQVLLHTTRAMQIAWAMYERIGFVRAAELDFQQGELSVFGFRLRL